MSPKPVKRVAMYVCGCAALAALVVLLTFLFSFLGTITCAVLAGMMAGAMKRSRWGAVPVSLIFPGVIVGMVRLARAELLGGQVLLLSSLCLGAFWLTYLSTWLVVCYEKKVPGAGSGGEAGGVQSGNSSACVGEGPGREVPEGTRGPVPGPVTLAELQGQWSRLKSGSYGQLEKKLLEIRDAEMRLTSIDSRGKVRLIASGRLSIGGDAEVRIETTPPPAQIPAAGSFR